MFDPVHDAYTQDIPRQRGVFCNRTLNLRSIEAIGYDMDYTLIHYNMAEWEARAYDHMKRGLVKLGWPVDDLEFDPDGVVRGLVIDTELGNIVKANRFGYVKQAAHGTSMMAFEDRREAYSRTLVDLEEDRWVFINTLFSISAAWMYSQVVDLLDAGQLPAAIGYESLWQHVQTALDAAHLEGMLKSEIMANPERYVVLDPEMPKTLLDQREAGKSLLLITNSGWEYTKFMMAYAVDRFLPDGMNWRDLFEIMVVAAGKPDFFSVDKPIFRLASEDGLVRPVVGSIPERGIYLGGNARQIEDFLGLSGDRLLFVGDHLFSDVNVSKSVMRWRTALVIRELEREVRALDQSSDAQVQIKDLMSQKVALEKEVSDARLALQRSQSDASPDDAPDEAHIQEEIDRLRKELRDLDSQIAPLVIEDGKAFNERWGYLMRAGNDKSHMTRQIERNADIYTSRVSNFLGYSPFVNFRAPRADLPHDPV